MNTVNTEIKPFEFPELVTRAAKFSKMAHESVQQKRKYTGEPYWTHPAIVAAIVAAHLQADELFYHSIAAAYLHDVIEDVEYVDHYMVVSLFGSVVGDMVNSLTNCEKAEGNRETRHNIDNYRLSSCSHPYQVHSIKVADIIHNISSIALHDPNFSRVYIKEKEKQLDILKCCHPGLMKLAQQAMDATTIFVKGNLTKEEYVVRMKKLLPTTPLQ